MREWAFPLKRWQLVWVDSEEVAVSFTHRLVARIAAWDTNRMMERRGSRRRVVVKDTLVGPEVDSLEMERGA